MDSKTQTKASSQAEILSNRVKKRLKHLQKWAKRMGFEAFRLYDRDIPEIPLVLDMYGSAISGALYSRPYEKDQQDEVLWLESMQKAIARSMGTDTENIILKQRQRQKGAKRQYEKIADQGFTRVIREEKYKFKVNLSDYLDTGLFLDRRSLRSMFGTAVGDRHVLNLFCYTASFSVYAAGGSAVSTDSVDLSNTYLGWARDNFALNGFEAKLFQMKEFFTKNKNSCDHSRCLSPSHGHRCLSPPDLSPHRLIRADVNAFLERAMAEGYKWDAIILDPPAFSNSKMASADFDLLKDYETLLARCLSLLSPEGKLWFSAGARSFRTSAAELEKKLAGRFPSVKVADISDKVIDEDFRGMKVPKTFVLTL